MTKTLALIAFLILISQSALACSLVGGQEQYEKNVEAGIAEYEAQLKNYEERENSIKKQHITDKVQVGADGTKTITSQNGTRITSKYAVDSVFSEDIKMLKIQIQSAKETQPISKYVDVEKYQQIYKDCAGKTGDNAPIAPCGNSYTIKECAHKAYENSKKE